MKLHWKLILIVFFTLSILLILCRKCAVPSGEIGTILVGILDYNRDFNDLNSVHYAVAKKIGIKPFTTRAEATKTRQNVELISTNDYYEVRPLTHSVPYVIPEMEEFLDDLSKDFRERLEDINAPLYKLQVTSVTRTKEDVQKLRKSNVNASENSVHVFATTIDISWSKFTKINKRDKRTMSDLYLKQVLGLALREMKRNGRCYVKHEIRQACFHITVRK